METGSFEMEVSILLLSLYEFKTKSIRQCETDFESLMQRNKLWLARAHSGTGLLMVASSVFHQPGSSSLVVSFSNR
jgi:hypothetical protein